MSRLITVVFFVLVPLISLGQYTLTGSVIDENQDPVPFAAVAIKNTPLGTSTTEDGKFKISIDTAGKYTLEISSIGYKPFSQVINVTGNQHLGEFILVTSSLGLNEVVVTGTMKPTFVSQSPVKIDVVTSDYLNAFIPSAASSIVESVTLVNGVQEVVACGVCFTNNISINGLPGPYTAVLMDGTPIYGNLASVYGLNGIPNMIIDRFEVIKGPNSTLYGSEAVAGVINIITKDPENQPILSIDLMGTSHWETFGNIAVAPKIGQSSGYIGLNYALVNSFEDNNQDGFNDRINMDRYSLFTKWNIHRQSGKTFTLSGKYYYEDRRNGVESYLTDRNYRELRGDDQIYGESIYTNRAELFGTYSLNTRANLKVDYSLSYHDQDSYYGSDHYVATQGIAFANFLWNKNISNHDLLMGLTTRYQAYNDNTVATSDSLDTGEVIDLPDNQFIPGVFIQDDWSVSSRFTMLLGARLDHYEAHGPIFSPRVNLKYKPGEWTTLRFNFGTGFRVVNLFTEDHAFVTGQREIEIQEDLKPEESYNVTLNLNHVYTLGKSQGMLDFDAFYTYFTNKIIPDYSDPQKIIYSNTEGNARTMGLGVNWTQEFTIPLSFSLGATFMNTTETTPNDAGELETRKVEFAPDYSGVFTINYLFRKPKTSLSYSLRVVGPMQLPEVYDLDTEGNPLETPRPTRSELYSISTIQVSKEFSARFSLYGGIQNLFNYVQPVSPLVGFNDPSAPTGFSSYFDTSYSFAPIHTREVYLGVKWNLARK